MQLPDVNVLLYAFRREFPHHARYRAWLEKFVAGEHRYAISELILSGVVRLASDPRIFAVPETIENALAFADYIRKQPLCVVVAAGPRHWEIFSRLCVNQSVVGKRISDVYHAALAIEHGCEWLTADKHFVRFPGLRWRHPLD